MLYLHLYTVKYHATVNGYEFLFPDLQICPNLLQRKYKAKVGMYITGFLQAKTKGTVTKLLFCMFLLLLSFHNLLNKLTINMLKLTINSEAFVV